MADTRPKIKTFGVQKITALENQFYARPKTRINKKNKL